MAGLRQVQQGGILANLWPAVAGSHPSSVSPGSARNAGAALGHLAVAMEAIEVDLSDAGNLIPPYGRLDRAHSWVPDPAAALSELPVEAADRAVLRNVADRLITAVPDLYQKLPKQLVHSDFNRQNVLMIEDRVSGVLDFEFSTVDLRAVDLAVALSAWAGPHLASWVSWDVLDAFGSGYFEIVTLTADEVEALPVLIELRFLAVLLHFIGRQQQGLGGHDDIDRWVRYTVGIDRWMTEHRDELLRRARSWS